MKKSPMTTPFPTQDMRELLDITWRRMVSRGGYGMVAQLRSWLPDPIGGVYWLYVDNQHISKPTSPFMLAYSRSIRVYKEVQSGCLLRNLSPMGRGLCGQLDVFEMAGGSTKIFGQYVIRWKLLFSQNRKKLTKRLWHSSKKAPGRQRLF